MAARPPGTLFRSFAAPPPFLLAPPLACTLTRDSSHRPAAGKDKFPPVGRSLRSSLSSLPRSVADVSLLLEFVKVVLPLSPPPGRNDPHALSLVQVRAAPASVLVSRSDGRRRVRRVIDSLERKTLAAFCSSLRINRLRCLGACRWCRLNVTFSYRSGASNPAGSG